MPRARNRLRAPVGHAKRIFALSFCPDALATSFFSMLLTLQPLHSSALFKSKKNDQFLPVEGLEPGNMHFLHFSQAPPCVRPSISLVLPLFSQDISTATANSRLRDRTVKYEERLGARVPRCKCIVGTAAVQCCCLRCCKSPCENDWVAG